MTKYYGLALVKELKARGWTIFTIDTVAGKHARVAYQYKDSNDLLWINWRCDRERALSRLESAKDIEAHHHRSKLKLVSGGFSWLPNSFKLGTNAKLRLVA